MHRADKQSASGSTFRRPQEYYGIDLPRPQMSQSWGTAEAMTCYSEGWFVQPTSTRGRIDHAHMAPLLWGPSPRAGGYSLTCGFATAMVVFSRERAETEAVSSVGVCAVCGAV